MTIRIHDASENKWVVAKEYSNQITSEKDGKGTPASDQAQFNDPELEAPLRIHEWGDADKLQLFEPNLPPNVDVDVHSHGEDEIIYVVKGSLELGKRSLGPGSSVYIQADTLYSFKSGPEGLQFLNFRPRKDTVYRNREQHMAYINQKQG